MHDKRIGSVLVIEPGSGARARHPDAPRHPRPGHAAGSCRSTRRSREVMSAPLFTLGLRAHRAGRGAADVAPRHPPRAGRRRRAAASSASCRSATCSRCSGCRSSRSARAIRAAPDLATLQRVAQDIRRFARNLLGQGVRRAPADRADQPSQRCADRAAGELVAARARRRPVAGLLAGLRLRRPRRADDRDRPGQRPRLRERRSGARPARAGCAFARDVNEALDACGYPLCKRQRHGRQPDVLPEPARVAASASRDWIEHGAPEDLLKASIYFDLRPLAGRRGAGPADARAGAAAGRPQCRASSSRWPRTRCARPPALNWHGGIETQSAGRPRRGRPQAARHRAVYVDAARLYALAHGIAATGTRERFAAVGRKIGAAPQEAREPGSAASSSCRCCACGCSFATRTRGADAPTEPNLVEVATLNDIDRRMLKESFRVARRCSSASSWTTER